MQQLHCTNIYLCVCLYWGITIIDLNAKKNRMANYNINPRRYRAKNQKASDKTVMSVNDIQKWKSQRQ